MHCDWLFTLLVINIGEGSQELVPHVGGEGMQQRQGPDEVGNSLLLKLGQAEKGMLTHSSQQGLLRGVGEGGIGNHGQSQSLQHQ